MRKAGVIPRMGVVSFNRCVVPPRNLASRPHNRFLFIIIAVVVLVGGTIRCVVRPAPPPRATLLFVVCPLFLSSSFLFFFFLFQPANQPLPHGAPKGRTEKTDAVPSVRTEVPGATKLGPVQTAWRPERTDRPTLSVSVFVKP